ncbi:unnamed protein product [Rotaria sordida]|uniref:Uncharacterized protein n=1 Tax=Rotaria sordida TaxID=392033 RepID=A0A815BGQ8_9BILA|nr:unnamed protein product [Rotaria sordida]CAF3881691.1 unnamed protein product [Rotaria sordida]
MNEIDKADTCFFHIFIKQYDQFNKIYTEANHLRQNDKKYTKTIAHIATGFQKIKSRISSNKNETPITLEDAKKINDLLATISYQMDQVLTNRNLLKRSKSTSTNRCCSLF